MLQLSVWLLRGGLYKGTHESGFIYFFWLNAQQQKQETRITVECAQGTTFGILIKLLFWLAQTKCFHVRCFAVRVMVLEIIKGQLTPSLVDTQSFLVYHMHHIGDSSLFFLQCTLWKVSASLFAALPATCHWQHWPQTCMMTLFRHMLCCILWIGVFSKYVPAVFIQK